jgi:membrane fusion protein
VTAPQATAPAGDLPFLETNPPHWVARGLSRIIIALAVLLVVVGLVVKVPETVTGRFTLVPVNGTDPVRTLKEGVVVDVRVRESDTVQAGAPLFLLRSSAAIERGTERRTLETSARANAERLAILRTEREVRDRADEGELKRLADRIGFLERQIQSKERRLALMREIADSSNQGVKSGALARFEATRLELDFRTLEEELSVAQNDLAESREDVARVQREQRLRELEFEQARRTLEESLETQGIRLSSLRTDLAGLTDSGVVLIAPCAGTVLRLRVNAPGAVVREGETLGELACRGERLQAELVLPQNGLPLVQPGQGVKLKFDAFPYQRYGVRFGEVKWLGPAGAGLPDTAAFRALVQLPDTGVRVRGKVRPLLAGMGGFADIVVGRRSLLSYAFEPLRALRESFVEPPAATKP